MIDVNQIGINIFIEFQIIQDSNPIKLAAEIDNLIAYGKKVFSWSKKVPPIEQALYCLKTIIPRSAEEKEKHFNIKKLRDSGSSYEEIAETLKVNHREIGFYLTRDYKKEWTLADYIVDYYKKDSSVYPKVDVIIDTDQLIIDKFEKIGIHGNRIQKV